MHFWHLICPSAMTFFSVVEHLSDVLHHPGHKNIVDDSMYRYLVSAVSLGIDLSGMSSLQCVSSYVQVYWTAVSNFSLVDISFSDGVTLLCDISQSSPQPVVLSLRCQVLCCLHGLTPAICTSQQFVRDRFAWHGDDVLFWCRSCVSCQQKVHTPPSPMLEMEFLNVPHLAHVDTAW